jgi:tRNA A-37 threonylcarbamoyl transferase component Bud32
MSKFKVIEPRVATPAPHASTGSHRLPDTLVSEQAQRLAVAAAVGAGLWTYGLLMDTAVRPATLGLPIPRVNVVIEIISILCSGLLFLYVKYAGCPPQKKTDVGLLYVVFNALGVALLNSWVKIPVSQAALPLSWNTIVILVWSTIMPTTPRKTMVVSLIAASMDPLVVWIGHLRGLPAPTVVTTFVLFAPNYACAVVASVPSRVLDRLGRRLRQAQEMGSYYLEELLGRGGMGEVWRARHRLLVRSAAIKLVRPELLGASGEADMHAMLRRFEREAQATAALSSPHTIRVYDFGVTADHTFYYVMELLNGRDLESLVRAFGPIPSDRVVFLLRQICHSLAEAHAHGLIHRDITPANVYVCRMGLEYDFVKVLDFGLVTYNGKKSMERTLLTGAHATTGTPAFMAPEVILAGEIDERADVYALGCVAYYLLTGQLVFTGDTPMKMFLHHLQTPPVPPSERTEIPIPRDLENLVLACLEKDPSLRPQNASEVLDALRELRSGDTWNNDSARRWWELHLTDLTGPIQLRPETERTTVAVHR